MPDDTNPKDAQFPAIDQPDQPQWWWAAVQILALAMHIPLSVLTGSQRALASGVEAFATGLLVFAAAWIVYLALRMSLDPWASLETTSAGLIFFWHWKAFGSVGTVVGVPLLTLAIAIAVIAAAKRYSSAPFFRRAAFATSVTLSTTMLVLFLASLVTTNSPVVVQSSLPPVEEPAITPDVVFVVLDSYAREDVLEAIYGYDNSAFIAGMKEQGFFVPSHALANYTGTHSSLPSVLDLGYPVKPGTSLGAADLQLLAKMMGGENNTVTLLKQAGYTYVHGDTQAWINRCGDQVDVCLSGPPIKATTFRLLADTPIGPLLYPISGEPETNLNLRRIEQLTNWSQIRPTWGPDPVFAFLHLEMPHPPLFLDSQCELDVRRGFGGPTLTWGVATGDALAARKQAYVRQVECANRTVASLLDQLNGDEIVVVTADHGPDSEGTLAADVSSWTDRQLNERMSVFTAIRLPGSCETPEVDSFDLVNTMRLVLSCIYGHDLGLLEGTYQAATYEGPVIPLKNPDGPADSQ